MKLCTKCKAIKPVKDFYKSTYLKSGYASQCKACMRLSSLMRQRRYKEENPVEYRKKHLRRQKKYLKSKKGNRSESFKKKEVARQRQYKDRRRGIEHDIEYASIVINDICSYCDKPSESIDHIIPVSKGGNGTSENLTGACRSCNSGKHAHSLLFYLLRKLN